MIIQTEKIYLFETTLNDPFIFDKTDGITTSFSGNEDRVIELLDIDKSVFLITSLFKGGIRKIVSYGGEDQFPFTVNGKVNYEYELEFNIPVDNDGLVEQLMGNEFSMVGFKRDFTKYACFGRFVADTLTVDNEIVQRVTMKTSPGKHVLYEVNTLNVTEVKNITGCGDPVFPPVPEVTEGFDYNMDSPMN